MAVSRFSVHPREALELVRFLTRSDVQVKRARLLSQPPTLPELYKLPEVSGPNPRFELLNQGLRTGTVMRPQILRRYASQAGFSGVEILPIEHDSWRFYRLLL